VDKMNDKSKAMIPWVIVGILFLAIIGGGVYIYRDLHPSASSATQTGQQNPAGSNRQGQRDPAFRAATSLLRLQQDPKVALTADQKTKLVPIIQELKNTTNPSQQFTEDKAKAIDLVLTDEQRTFLTQSQSGQGTGANPQWGGQQGRGSGPGQGSAQGQSQGTRQFNPSDMYDRVLKALQ
jgi:hypothetical protein